MSKLTKTLSQKLQQLDMGLILAALLTLFSIQALLRPGLPAAADIPIHLYRTMEYGHAWTSDVLLPRWAPNLAYGYGYPLFIFAPPLPYLLGLGLHTFGFTFETALKGLIILTILLYATGMYLLARDLLKSISAALVAATAYAFAPFALREALLQGGNVPQLLAIGFFPWTLWAVQRTAAQKSNRWLAIAILFYAAIILSHLFHALIFSPVILLFGLIWAIPPASWPARVRPLLTLPIGLMLTAFFWLPAFIERYATRAQADIYREKSPFFIRYPEWTELLAWIAPLDARAANPEVPLSLSLVTLALAALGVISLIPHRRARLPLVGFIVLTGTTVFMVLPLSQPIWETITILQVAEFPWRLLGVANLGLAVLAGAAMRLLPNRGRGLLTALCLSCQIFAVAPLLYPATPFAIYGDTDIGDQINYERKSQSIGTTTLGEYLPHTVQQIPTGSPLIHPMQRGEFPPRLDKTSLPPKVKATLLQQTAILHHYRIHTPYPITVRLLHYNYPGWQATVNGQPVPLTTEPETGFMRVAIPAGMHELRVQFVETPLRQMTLTLSGLTAAILLAILIQSTAPKSPPTRLPLTAITGSLAMLIILSALWLKPQLKPLFALNSPAGITLAAGQQTDIQFAEGLRLIGYDLSSPVVSPGERMRVVLYWQATRPITANLQPFVHLDRLSDFATMAETANYTPGDTTTESVLPTFHWDTARYVRDEHHLHVPPQTPPQAYALRVGMLNPQTNRRLPLAKGTTDTAQLTTINVRPLSAATPLRHPLNIRFEPSAPHEPLFTLRGYQLEAVTAEAVRFTLAWQVNQQSTVDYTIFAQLLTTDNQLVASYDSPPRAGAYPTSTWLPQQLITDPRHIPLTDVAAGRYRLVVGLYNPQTDERLRLPTGPDFVELTTLKVE